MDLGQSHRSREAGSQIGVGTVPLLWQNRRRFIYVAPRDNWDFTIHPRLLLRSRRLPNDGYFTVKGYCE